MALVKYLSDFNTDGFFGLAISSAEFLAVKNGFGIFHYFLRHCIFDIVQIINDMAQKIVF